MTELTPQQRRKAQTHQQIIEEALQLIVAHGLRGLSIRELADALDYTPGALYRYFDSKDDLIDAVRAACFQRLNAAIAAEIEDAESAAEMLLQGGLAYIEYAALHPVEYQLMFHLEPSPAAHPDQREQSLQMLLHIVRLGIAQGEITPTEGYHAEAITYHCWITVHGIASLQSSVLEDEKEKVKKISRMILEKVIAGFTR